MFNFTYSCFIVSAFLIFMFPVARGEGILQFDLASWLKMRTSKYAVSCLLPQKPFALISRRAPSSVIADLGPIVLLIEVVT